MPGDPVDAYLGMGSKATPEQKQQIREELGLDKSLPEQYVIGLEILLKENWGHLPSSNFQFLKSLETTYGIHSC